MSPFKPLFNVFVPLLRLIVILLGLILLIITIYQFIRHIGIQELEHIKVYLYAFISLIIGFFWIIIIKSFLKQTKNYTITDTFIKEYNFLRFSSTCYDKNDVTGFSTCRIRNKYIVYDEVTIYVCDQTKINLKEFAYFNFSRIQDELFEKGYDYLGEEQYISNFFGREYQF